MPSISATSILLLPNELMPVRPAELQADSGSASKASANFEHGVLTLTLPRAESARVRQIPVTTNQSSGTQQAIPAQSSAKGETSKTPETQPDSKQPVASGANGGSGDSSKK